MPQARPNLRQDQDPNRQAAEVGSAAEAASQQHQCAGGSSAELVRQATHTAIEAGGSLRRRRRTFLRCCWPHLGPTQQRHVSDHCWVVSTAAGRLGRIGGLDAADLDHLTLAGLFHDIGKCLIPEAILAKPGGLNDAERAVMGRHAQLGARIAAELGAGPEILQLILNHHTCGPRVVGAGGIKASLPTRLLCVADALVSMMSDRPYCSARTARQALAELRRCVGTQFDVIAVDTAHILYHVPWAA